MIENKYKSLIEKQQLEIENFPMFFSFDNKQFQEGMEKIGLKDNDIDKIVSLGAGGYIKRDDIQTYKDMFKRHKEEINTEIANDKTGSGFIKDMFKYELINHEYGYTMDLQDTISSLGLSIEDINNSSNLSNGLNLAINEINHFQSEEESEEDEL